MDDIKDLLELILCLGFEKQKNLFNSEYYLVINDIGYLVFIHFSYISFKEFKSGRNIKEVIWIREYNKCYEHIKNHKIFKNIIRKQKIDKLLNI